MTTYQNTPSFEDFAEDVVSKITKRGPVRVVALSALTLKHHSALTRQREELAQKLESIRARLVIDRNMRVADSLALSELDTLIQTMKGDL